MLEPQLLSVLLKPREPQAAAAGAAGCRNPAIFRHVFQPRLLLLLSRRASGAVASNQNKTLLSWAKCSDKTVVDSPTMRRTPKTRCGARGCPCPLPPTGFINALLMYLIRVHAQMGARLGWVTGQNVEQGNCNSLPGLRHKFRQFRAEGKARSNPGTFLSSGSTQVGHQPITTSHRGGRCRFTH